jgi:hypothetical protein
VKWLINQNNPKTMTVSFTRQAAMDHFRVSRRTVDYWVFRLRFFGLLASIASGRSARYTPKGQPTTDLAPVYTFTIPNPDHKLFGIPGLRPGLKKLAIKPCVLALMRATHGDTVTLSKPNGSS